MVVLQKNALGQEVYDQVFYTLDLEERDYFGLLFTDHYHVQASNFFCLFYQLQIEINRIVLLYSVVIVKVF